jgi:hypothetical protein
MASASSINPVRHAIQYHSKDLTTAATANALASRLPKSSTGI